MKRQMILVIAILGIVLLSACAKKDVSTDLKQEAIVKNEENKEKDVVKEETKKYKLEKHEEDWRLFFGDIGKADWNANMPKAGIWGEKADVSPIYSPTFINGKKVNFSEGEKPGFFYIFGLNDKDIEQFLGKRAETLEELPEYFMAMDRHWDRKFDNDNTLDLQRGEYVKAIVETKEKLVIDGYEFMRAIGRFEIYNKESNELLKTKKYIAYFYNAVDAELLMDERLEHNYDTFANYYYLWCEEKHDLDDKNFDLVVETADKIMSTFKLNDYQKEYLKTLNK